MANRKRGEINWLAVRLSYEAGGRSLRSIGREHGVSHPMIQKRAKDEAWVAGEAMPAKQVAVEPLLPPIIEEIRRAPSPEPPAQQDPPAQVRSLDEPLPIRTLEDAAAASPKALVDSGRDVMARLLSELDCTTAYLGEIEELILAETAGDADGQRRHAMLRAVSLPTRATVLKNLATAAKTFADAAPAALEGKKAQRQERAEEASSSGKYGVRSSPPRLIVSNQ